MNKILTPCAAWIQCFRLFVRGKFCFPGLIGSMVYMVFASDFTGGNLMPIKSRRISLLQLEMKSI